MTKSIYWLSVAGSGNAALNTNLGYPLSVPKVAEKIGGDFQENWHIVFQKCKMPKPRKFIFLALGGVAVIFVGMIIGIFLDAFWLSLIFTGFAAMLILPSLNEMGQTLELSKALISDEEAAKISHKLAEQLIVWTSKRIKKPLTVLLAESNYPNIEVIGLMNFRFSGLTNPPTMARIEPAAIDSSEQTH